MSFRRGARLRAIRSLAPRVARDAKPELPLIIAGLLSQSSGLGAAARACHDALKAAGLPVYGVDLTTALRYEVNHTGFTYADGHDLIGKGTVMLHVSGPLVPSALLHLGRGFVSEKHIIGHWFWELPQLPEDWRHALPFVHEIFVNTHFVANAVRPVLGGRPIHIVPYPLCARYNQEPSPAIYHKPFTVLFVFNVLSNFARKNPCAAIEAFRHAFGDDPQSRLVIKHVNASHWPESERRMQLAAGGALNIELIGDVLDDESMDTLFESADVVISLHRAEGLGLIIAEAMLRGIPVVATDWSGNTDFLTADTGWPIGYDLIPVDDPQGNYDGARLTWADPHIDEAVVALRTLQSDLELRNRLGRAAALKASEFFDPARYVEHVRGLLSAERS